MLETVKTFTSLNLLPNQNLSPNGLNPEKNVNLLTAEEYGITSLGFLPEKCLNELPPGWHHFQPLLDKLSSDDDDDFRALVHTMPPYSPSLYSLTGLSQGQKRFLYSILTMCMQKYIWGTGTSAPVDIIPQELGAPLFEISNEFGLLPALTYAGVILYNWSTKDESQPVTLDNLQVCQRLTKVYSFEWFCLVHVAIEAEGGKVLIPILNIKKNMQDNDLKIIKQTLRDVISVMKSTKDVLNRMYEKCTPEDFWTFRFYFEGTNDEKFFPNGLRIKGFEDKPIVVRGASGGQSPLMQIFDALFSIEHVGHGKEFLIEMRDYMLSSHRKFLEDFSMGQTLKDFVENSGDEELQEIFIEGVDTFTAYRQYHYTIAHDYIFKMIKRNQIDVVRERKDTETELYKKNETGTGGTDAPRFLKQTILATKETRTLQIKEDHEGSLKNQGKGSAKIKLDISINRTIIENLLLSLIVAIMGSFLMRMLM